MLARPHLYMGIIIRVPTRVFPMYSLLRLDTALLLGGLKQGLGSLLVGATPVALTGLRLVLDLWLLLLEGVTSVDALPAPGSDRSPARLAN